MDLSALQDLLNSLQQQRNAQEHQSSQNNHQLLDLLHSLQPPTHPHPDQHAHDAPQSKRQRLHPPHLHSTIRPHSPSQSTSADPPQPHLAAASTAHPGQNQLLPTRVDQQLSPHQDTLPAPDLTSLSASEALPILIKLVESTDILQKIQAIKETQDHFELRSIDQRNRIKAEHDRVLNKSASGGNEEKVKKARAEFELELARFDRSLLSKWDQLRVQQQLELQHLQVPTFFQTDEPQDLTKQKIILDVLLDRLNK